MKSYNVAGKFTLMIANNGNVKAVGSGGTEQKLDRATACRILKKAHKDKTISK
jgi:hypothetical protein